MRKIVSLCLSIIFIVSTSSYSFADTNLDNPPIEPTKPKVENYQDNDKIKEYNKEAEEYNKKVDEYNVAVDNEYNNAKEEVDKQNNEGQIKQETSQKAHDEAVATNEAEQERVDNINKQIDEDNAAEEQRINQENAQKQEQYNVEYEQYLKDKDLEQRILDAGYESIDQYNETVTNYNDYVDRYNNSVKNYHLRNYYANEETVQNSPQRNTNAPKITIADTYTIVPAENKSGRMIPVHLEHNFPEVDMYDSIDFEIDANDTIIFYGLAPNTDAINNFACLFFYNTDEAHTYGLWSNSDSRCEAYPTADNEYGWTNGDTHTISYANSLNDYYWDFEDIYMVYNYNWISFYEYKAYFDYANIPNEPILELETFISKEYENPNFVEVPEVFVWENLPDPIKREYLNYVSLLDLFAVPASTPINKETPINTSNSNVTTNQRNITQFVPFGLGDGTESIESVEPIKKATITNNKAPLATTEGSWALINLIATLLVFLIAIILLVMAFVNKRKENEELQIKNKMIGRIISIIVAIITGFIFLITEDMSLPMILVDKWTLLMIILLIVQLIIMILCKHKEIEKAS